MIAVAFNHIRGASKFCDIALWEPFQQKSVVFTSVERNDVLTLRNAFDALLDDMDAQERMLEAREGENHGR